MLCANLSLSLFVSVVWHIVLERRREEEAFGRAWGSFPAKVSINVCSCVTGDCDFQKPFSSCGYTQGRDDDLDWEQFDTSEKASLDPWMPPGKRHTASEP